MTDVLRNAISESGMSVAAVAREAGIAQPILARFVNGKDIRLATAERLADYFGLTLTAPTSKPKKKSKRAG